MVCNLCEFKEYIDKEMILILGQMDSPTEIFDHVYLVGRSIELSGVLVSDSIPVSSNTYCLTGYYCRPLNWLPPDLKV